MTREKISRDDAKDLIGEAKFGVVVITNFEAKDTLGHVPDEDLEYEATVESYRFGDELEDDG
ncbi:hypothetical protein [Natrinema ejinorense]|uniref:Uncharacterized protein n=1 Tax=Natrinema ejinorense TaxID=373386 RepID=A0A2A5QR94_9EURY|nr:hypothetical protein [Natrinema ejinorense]PCR89319.1 hypothetical protein CP557_01460 [Natrinema ejinorense]